MCATRTREPRSAGNRLEALLTWFGGGDWRDLGERHERSTHAVAGALVLVLAALAWLVAALALAASLRWPTAVVAAATFVFAVLVGVVGRAVVSGPMRGRTGVVGRALVAVAVGVLVGELAALTLFSGSIDRIIDERSARGVESAPAVVRASTDLDAARTARARLEGTVEAALVRREDALIVARCEFHPVPGCPQTHITGVPGAGPGTRTAQEFLADTQQQLDAAVAERERRAPELDTRIAEAERALAQARDSAIGNSDHGLGARWTALNEHTLPDPGALLLRLLTIGFFVLLSLLPLILNRWRGETSQDRGTAARAERDRADLQADTAIALKRAEVRVAIDAIWAEQQLASARLAAEAQAEIDRLQHRRRVIEAVEPAVQAHSERIREPAADEVPLPIAADAESAPAVVEAENLPERAEPRGGSLVSPIPDITRAAARWLRPFVPPIVARTVETTTRPVRSVLHIMEETEEVHFDLKRTRRVAVHSEESVGQSAEAVAPDVAGEPPAESAAVRTRRQPRLPDRDRPGALREPGGARQLPPGQ